MADVAPITNEERQYALNDASVGNFMFAGSYVRAYEARLTELEAENERLRNALAKYQSLYGSPKIESASISSKSDEKLLAINKAGIAKHRARTALKGDKG